MADCNIADGLKEAQDRGPRKDLWKPPFNAIVVGSTGVGKSHYLKRMLREELLDRFDYVVIMSPTAIYSGDWDEFVEVTDPDDERTKLFKIGTDFESVISEIIESQSACILAHGKKNTPQLLLVLDDMLDARCISNHGVLAGFSAKSRHINVSLIIVSQRISAIARCIRLNSSIVVLFSNFNYSEVCTFVEQYVNKRHKSKLLAKLDQIYDVPYAFLLCDNRNPSQSKRLLLNGERVLQLDDGLI
jgi:Cdc6-like AAA superfamily ATPase